MYCTLADILNSMPEEDLIQLTDEAMPAEIVDATKVEAAIAHAGEVIDGYLRSRYSLPLSPAPDLLTTLAVDITRYRLYGLRIRISPPEMVVQAYKDAIDLLRQIQSGKVALGAESVGGEPVASQGATFIGGPDRLFGRRMP